MEERGKGKRWRKQTSGAISNAADSETCSEREGNVHRMGCVRSVYGLVHAHTESLTNRHFPVLFGLSSTEFTEFHTHFLSSPI